MTKKLKLIQIEMGGSLIMTALTDTDTAPKLIAIYNAPTSVLRTSRTDPSVMDEYVRAAEDMDAEEARGILADFFEQWSGYQMNILSFAALNTEKMAATSMKMRGLVPKVESEATSLTDEIEETAP